MFLSPLPRGTAVCGFAGSTKAVDQRVALDIKSHMNRETLRFALEMAVLGWRALLAGWSYLTAGFGSVATGSRAFSRVFCPDARRNPTQ
jgi:hypothetical protein